MSRSSRPTRGPYGRRQAHEADGRLVNPQRRFTDIGDKVGRSLKSMFGSQNERMVRTLAPQVVRVNELEGWAKGLSASSSSPRPARGRSWCRGR
jgi:hypothetical protein